MGGRIVRDCVIRSERRVHRRVAVGAVPLLMGGVPGGREDDNEALSKRLDGLLRELPSAVKRVSGGFFDALVELPGSTKNAVEQGSLQPLARWWESHRSSVADERERMRTQRFHPGLALRPGGLLQKWPWGRADDGGEKRRDGRKDRKTEEDIELDVSGVVVRMGRFLTRSLSPWDFDRREFALALVQKWEDWEVVHGSRGARRGEWLGRGGGRKDGDGGENGRASVKVTSTMNPLQGEWKVTGRTPLWRSADWGGVVFAKAGVFLAGERAPYVGLEADRVWRRRKDNGRQKHMAPFVNVSYRSSRLPQWPVVRLAVGVQFGLKMGALPVTLRFGLRPLETRGEWFLLPVSNDQYF